MHPILSNRSWLMLYLAGWAILGALLGAVIHLAEPRPFLQLVAFVAPLTAIYSSVCLSAWYVCRAMPLGRSDLLPQLGTLLGSAVVSSTIWVAVGGLVALALGSHRSDLTILFVAGIPLYLFSAIIHYLLIAFESARAAERHALESQVTAREAELRALRAQLHPHFLFNSLNSIASLAGSNPAAARAMCEGLGDFLRRTLNLATRERVPLAEEVSLVERYLSIEQVRFGERLGVTTDVPADAARCLVPPLLLQPLVENAVKHGVSGRIEGGVIGISAVRRGDHLVVSVTNPRDEDAPQRRGEGHGLENVRRRLEALAHREAALEVKREPDRFTVTLALPAIEADSAARAGVTPASSAAAATNTAASAAASTAPGASAAGAPA